MATLSELFESSYEIPLTQADPNDFVGMPSNHYQKEVIRTEGIWAEVRELSQGELERIRETLTEEIRWDKIQIGRAHV